MVKKKKGQECLEPLGCQNVGFQLGILAHFRILKKKIYIYQGAWPTIEGKKVGCPSTVVFKGG